MKILYIENLCNFDKQVKFEQTTVIKHHLTARRVHHALQLILHCIHDPEVWLSSTIQLINYCLKHSEVLSSQKVTKLQLFQLYKINRAKPEFEYFQHTIDYFFTKLVLKYLSLKMYEEALYMAFELDS